MKASSTRLAELIDFHVCLIDDTLQQMKGSASFPQDGTRLSHLEAHFEGTLDDRVIEAIILLMKT